MIKAEFSYNPYIMEMVVKFNGKSPRINSLVEKYQDVKLQYWIDKIPEIFRDEMNGYDFELEYSGIVSDYNKLIKAFEKSGIGRDEVSFFYKNELEDSKTKSERIDAMLDWLNANRNRRFDYEEFMEANKELINEPYPYIIINGNVTEDAISNKYISVEHVDNALELENTDLNNIPILICIDDELAYRSSLIYLLKRDDVRLDQIFYCISPILNRSQIERVIKDLGDDTPKIVDNVSDNDIITYLLNYPVIDYIKSFMDVMRDAVKDISKELEEENKKSIAVNAGIHSAIDNLEMEIDTLKKVDELIVQRDNLNKPEDFDAIELAFLDRIDKWRKRKTKTTNQAEALELSKELNSELVSAMQEVCQAVDDSTYLRLAAILQNYYDTYRSAGIDVDFNVNHSVDNPASQFYPIDLINAFLTIKEENYVTPKESFLGSLFSNGQNESHEPTLEITYLYNEWRNISKKQYASVIHEIMEKKNEIIKKYYDELAELFHKHILELIDARNVEKNRYSAQLSDDEKLLQDDNDWLSSLKDIIAIIERG